MLRLKNTSSHTSICLFSIQTIYQHLFGDHHNEEQTHNYPVVRKSLGVYPEPRGMKSIIEEKKKRRVF